MKRFLLSWAFQNRDPYRNICIPTLTLLRPRSDQTFVESNGSANSANVHSKPGSNSSSKKSKGKKNEIKIGKKTYLLLGTLSTRNREQPSQHPAKEENVIHNSGSTRDDLSLSKLEQVNVSAPTATSECITKESLKVNGQDHNKARKAPNSPKRSAGTSICGTNIKYEAEAQDVKCNSSAQKPLGSTQTSSEGEGNAKKRFSPPSGMGSLAQASKDSSLSKTESATSVDRILHCIESASFLSKSKPFIKAGALNLEVEIAKNKGDWQMPSVSRILNETMSPSAIENLARWEKTMIARLGSEGFLNYKKDLFQRGKDFHSIIHKYLQGEEVSESGSELNPALQRCWQSVRPVLKNVQYPHVIERYVVHQELNYRGIVDCVAEYMGRPVVVEWKQKERKSTQLTYTYDNPLQLMAYVGALNNDPQFPFQVRDCLLVVAYTDGSPAQIYSLTPEEQLKYWLAWLERVKQFWVQQKQNQSHPQPSEKMTDASQSLHRTMEPKPDQQQTQSKTPEQTSDEKEKPGILGRLWKILK